MDFREEIAKLLVKKTKLKKKDLVSQISQPPHPSLGDYSFPCFNLGSNPPQEALKLKEKIKLPLFLKKIEAVGPYLNFFLNPPFLAQEILTKIYREKRKYGSQKRSKKKKIIIDFSSPNIAKPFGITHLRSTVLGKALSEVFHFLGYQVIKINHLGDWGTQFGKLLVAYKKWGKKEELNKEPIKYLLKLYVRFHQEAEKDVSLNQQAKTTFKKLEEGNKEFLTLWKLFRELSLKEFQKIYRLLEIDFDYFCGESFYNKKTKEILKEVTKKTKTFVSEGALFVDLKKYGLPPFILKKSDGTTTYGSRDLAAAFYRLKHYQPEKILYVVGSEQNLYFQQLFKILELIDKKNKEKFVHVNFGLFVLSQGKLSTRKGEVIFLEEVLDKAIKQVEKIIEEKNPSLKNKKEIAKKVGIGAIIFADLNTDREREVRFHWQKFLSFEGETGPYLQYTQARASAILRKAKKEQNQVPSPKVNFALLKQPEEIFLLKLLNEFPQVVLKVAQTYKPHYLAKYLLQLAQTFNEFYHRYPVISAPSQIQKIRLLLVEATRQVLENGLTLLGLKAPPEM